MYMYLTEFMWGARKCNVSINKGRLPGHNATLIWHITGSISIIYRLEFMFLCVCLFIYLPEVPLVCLDSSWVRKEPRQFTVLRRRPPTGSDTAGHSSHTLPCFLSLCIRWVLQSRRTPLQWTRAAATTTSSKSSQRRQTFIVRGLFVSAEPLNAFHWEKASDVRCLCIQVAHELIKMGNKQTIFTDEQLDAYQVIPHVHVQHVGELDAPVWVTNIICKP